MIVASEVIRIGRRRMRLAFVTASSSGRPCRRRMRVKSTIRMLFETTMPTIMIRPMRDMTFSVLPEARRISSTPVRPGGIARRMMNGSRNEENWATRIR